MIAHKWRLLIGAAATLSAAMLVILYAALGAYVYLEPTLPSADSLRGQNRLLPLRIYTRDGQLLSQFGEQLRVPVRYEDIPDIVREAFLSAEDDNFFGHGGIDYKSVIRALWVDLSSGVYSQGSSTITMQLARTLFLSSEKRLKRKAQEVFLTLRMEHEFSKQDILTTYLNEIFFGQRAYGVAAAAEVYFGKSLKELSVAEAALLAGLPQSPSRYNPVSSPKRAMDRRQYVLRRMRELGYIDARAADEAQREPIRARAFALSTDVDAPYVAEMARLELIKRFGEASINHGYRIITTVDGRLQTAANRALRLGLLEYDRRHGYRGAVRHAKNAAGATMEQLEAALAGVPEAGGLRPAIVVSMAPKAARIYVRSQGYTQLGWDSVSWARDGGATGDVGSVVHVGDVIYVAGTAPEIQLAQVPRAQGALVSLDPNDGAIVALVGGFDYSLSKFNRATQAARQPGSGFKPFVYSAALDHGLTPASVFLDAPILFEDKNAEQAWRPQNSEGVFSGPMRMREALVKSRNLVSIRILRNIGADAVIDYATRFGFKQDSLPRNQTLALGTLSASPLEVATGYATFANNGYKIEPYFIDRIEDADGKVLYRATPRRVCEICDPAPPAPTDGDVAAATTPSSPVAAPAPVPVRAALPARAGVCQREILEPPQFDLQNLAPRVITAANAWLMDDILGDVIRRGTGVRALVLGRRDISGKTGTTNEERDTWFNGFNRSLVASVWVGFDDLSPMGEAEQGSRTAVPVWVYYMREALRGTPDVPRPRPAGLVDLRISPRTGLLASENDASAITETFLAEHLPGQSSSLDTPQNNSGPANNENLF